MKCPYCGHESSKVVESRCADEGSRVRRRRECEHCLKRFTTYEVVEYIPLMVVKRGGTREKFERKKVFDGLLRACEKRAISLEKIENMTDEIESKLQNMLEREVKSSYIGELSMEQLKKCDEVAYIRFASVYRQFKDVQAFMSELQSFLDSNKD
ncbi:MAG: transcriptional regulator NrdR [Clostridia bacterium]|nr:transcriptional regulator NrdR [Clostridia bacterium]